MKRSFAVLVLATGCVRPAAAPAPGGVAIAMPRPGIDDPDDADASDERDAAAAADHRIGFGYAPGDVAVIEWTPGDEAMEGPARLRLPNGEELAGTWRTEDNLVPRPGTPVESTDPRGDPGDPTSMPAPHPHARQIVIDLEGDRGTQLHCTIPDGASGTCRDDAAGFSARMR